GSSGRAFWPTRSSAPTATLPIRPKSAGAWARSVSETGGDAREEHQEAIDRTGPNYALYLTASSVRSCLALSKPFFHSGARLSPVFLAAALLLGGVSVSWMALVHPLG